MPSHSSHLLQPLDVGCFSPLKRAYSRQIEGLIRDHINHITKLEFLPAFYAAYKQSITKENICASFQGAGLVPHDPDRVIAKLDVKLRTPTPPALETTLWEARTPSQLLHQITLRKGVDLSVIGAEINGIKPVSSLVMNVPSNAA